MGKKILIVLAFLLAILLGVQQYLILHTPTKEDKLLEKLIQLESKLDSLSNKKDSVRVVIQQIDKEIIINEKHYEKVVNDVIAQPYSMDTLFVIGYIDRFIENEGPRYNLYRTRKAEHRKSPSKAKD